MLLKKLCMGLKKTQSRTFQFHQLHPKITFNHDEKDFQLLSEESDFLFCESKTL